MVQKQYPGTKVIFSEGCVEYSRFADTKETAKAEMYAHDMIGNFRAGLSAYFDWNLILDMEGGPNHVGNFCAVRFCVIQKMIPLTSVWHLLHRTVQPLY